MRVLIDTNVLFSAALNSNGTPFQAYVKAVTPPNTGIICRQMMPVFGGVTALTYA